MMAPRSHEVQSLLANATIFDCLDVADALWMRLHRMDLRDHGEAYHTVHLAKYYVDRAAKILRGYETDAMIRRAVPERCVACNRPLPDVEVYMTLGLAVTGSDLSTGTVVFTPWNACSGACADRIEAAFRFYEDTARLRHYEEGTKFEILYAVGQGHPKKQAPPVDVSPGPREGTGP